MLPSCNQPIAFIAIAFIVQLYILQRTNLRQTGEITTQDYQGCSLESKGRELGISSFSQSKHYETIKNCHL